MLDQIHGYLLSIQDNNAEVFLPNVSISNPDIFKGHRNECPPGISYQIMMSSFAAEKLHQSVQTGPQGWGSPIHFWLVHYLESQAQGATLIPRLAGFLSAKDRGFYELFRSVKGIGPRKALKSLALDTPQIAGAIAARDAKLLQTLPEIGKKMAETIATTLHDRVSDYLIAEGVTEQSRDSSQTPDASDENAGMMSEALAALMQLGESQHSAMQLIQKAMSQSPAPQDTQSLLQCAFEVKNI